MRNFVLNREIQYYIDLITVLTQKELKIKYRNSFLGYLWSICYPLSFAIVFFVSFKVIMKVAVEDYALFLIVGLFPWQWFSNSVNSAPMIYLGNAPLVKKLNFPKNLLPLTLVLQDMLHFIFAIPVIVLFLYIYNKPVSLSWIYGVPLLLSLQFIMTYGFCLIVSSLNLFFRDIERLTTLSITFLFYFTPVVYLDTMVPERYKPLINLNPLAPLMISWRNLFLYGSLDLVRLLFALFYSISVFALGYIVYRKLSWRFAEVL